MTSIPKFYAGIGSRKTPADMLQHMRNIGAGMAKEPGWVLRSGAAEGADQAFEDGCDYALGEKQIFLPWQGFNGHMSPYKEPTLDAFRMAREFHPNWEALTVGARKLMARNSHQLFGPDLNQPVRMVICWTPNGAGTGGTGQALRIARAFDIPIIDLGGLSLKTVEDQINEILDKVA